MECLNENFQPNNLRKIPWLHLGEGRWVLPQGIKWCGIAMVLEKPKVACDMTITIKVFDHGVFGGWWSLRHQVSDQGSGCEWSFTSHVRKLHTEGNICMAPRCR